MLEVLLLAFAAAPPPAAIQEPIVEVSGSEADIALARIRAEHEASELGYREKAAAFAPRFQELADSFPGTDAGFEAEFQLLSDTWWIEDVPARNAAARERLDHMLDVYADHIGMGRVAEIAYNFDRAQLPAIFDLISAASTHREVHAAMLFGKAKLVKGEERTAMLERLKKEYGALHWRYSTYAQLADAHLHPYAADDLQVGKPAPEIVGVDLHGKPMKLSDFRGKVVVLDFWGDW